MLSAVLAFIGGGMVLIRAQSMSSNWMRLVSYLLAGLLYVVFIIVVIYCVVILGVAAVH